MPRIRAAKIDRTVATLAKIRAAAREVFNERGLNEASVEEIAKRSGLSRATIYLYFSSKENMLLDMLQEDIGNHTRHYDALAAINPVSKASVRKWLLSYIDLMRPNVTLLFTSSTIQPDLAVHGIRHREAIIATLGARFKGFDLGAVEPARRAEQRVKCYMMILLIEQAHCTYSTAPTAPTLDDGLDVLADLLLRFMRTGEFRAP